MAYLNIQRLDGRTEQRELSRSQPISIGRQTFNDICIPEPEVLPLHCRIGWNKKNFEVTAATTEGVEVNSNNLAHAELTSGDVIRIGSYDITFEDVSLLQDEEPATEVSRRPTKTSTRKEPVPQPAEEMSTYEGKVLRNSEDVLAALIAEAREEGEMDDESIANIPLTTGRSRPQTVKKPNRPLRPGEQDAFKSPLVLGLAGGTLGLLLITGIFWFLIGREQSNRLYDRAVEEMNGGQYTQSITSFERFITQYPKHGLRRQAEIGLAKVAVLREISGATPAWKRGLERLNDLIKAHRNDSDFSDMHSTIFQYADQITLGAARSAETLRDPELLDVSKDAQNLLERYADPAAPPVGTLARINEQRIKAERAIEKQKTFDTAMSVVDAAITNKKPMEALSERLRLVRQFPEFINSQRVKASLQKALELEKSVVTVDDTEVPAETTDDPAAIPEPILGLLQSRSRTDELPQGQLAFVLAKDSCYAVDSVTGELVWRRVIGFDSPFFPVKTSGVQPALLLFDTRKQALIACQLDTGKLIWRQPLGARVIGAPLVHEGQIYLPVDGRSLVRIDVDSGRISAKVQLSQNLATSPVLSRDGNYLLVPGEMAMVYSLTLHATPNQPALAVVATTFTDHAGGAVVAPPLSMGKLFLLCENDLADSANLRLWDASKPNESLIELASTRTAGQVRDTPVLRGNQLVVPSVGEQFAAFAVSDDAGHTGIAPIGQYRADQAKMSEQLNAPLFIALGSDGQFWSAGTAFRRFEVVSDSIRMDSNSTAPGVASQPLQSFGDFFFVGRKSRYSDAVTFSAIERDRLVNPWRIVVGDGPREVIATRDDGVFWVGESGTVYNIGKNRMSQGGVDSKAGTDLELPTNVTRPIRATALHDQRIVIAAAGDAKMIYLFNAAGQLVSKHAIPEMVETDPVLLDEGLVLPLPGRLKLLPLGQSKKVPQDWIAPVGDGQELHWSHLVRVDGRELIACDQSGRLTRVQFRQGDIPHLAEVAKLQLEQPVDLHPVLRGDSLYVCDVNGDCLQLNIRSFDAEGRTKLSTPVKGLWATESGVLVQAGSKLQLLSEGKTLPEKWSIDLAGLELIGPCIARPGGLSLASRDGTYLELNPETGAEIRRLVLPQALSLGLRQLKSGLVAVAVDGTLYRIEDR